MEKKEDISEEIIGGKNEILNAIPMKTEKMITVLIILELLLPHTHMFLHSFWAPNVSDSCPLICNSNCKGLSVAVDRTPPKHDDVHRLERLAGLLPISNPAESETS